MLEGSIAFTLSGATEFLKMGFGSLTNTGMNGIREMSTKYLGYFVSLQA